MGKKKMHNQQSAESTRIWGGKFLKEFCASENDSHTFDTSLTNSDRGIIHQMCRNMGIGSKSSGSGDQRYLQIFKRVGGSLISKYKKRDDKGEGKGSGERKKKSKEKLRCVSFPPEAKPVLQDLFTRYPPCDGDTTGTSLGIYTGHLGNRRKWKDDFFCRPQMSKEDILKKVASLSSRQANDERFAEICKERTNLPIAAFRDAITSAVESNQVVLIAGETGCGKTTQVPQYLLDHMWNKQESCKIICTQPRRISAISVSERLAWERGEAIGTNVGYKVRLQSTGGRQSSVVFCTNGILLRVLVGKGSGSCIPDITHIIVDEIHERDCYSDFMLAIIRDFLPSNPHLRLILMSATLDAERFSGYFGGCPVVRVPGFTYPVRTYYLEDALSVLKSDKNNHLISADANIPDGKLDIKDEDKVALDEAIDLAWKNDDFDALLALVSSGGSHEVYNYRQSSTWLTPLMVFAGKGRISDVCKLLLLGADCKLKSKEGITALELAEKENQSEAAQIIREHMDNFQANSQLAQDLLDKYMTTINAEEVDVDLIARLMWKICGDSEVGAILVFLPGWEEISKTKEKMLANPYFADSTKFNILCLHSRIPADEQRKVFQRPSKGCRKIVLATNIAESAVTIDDVVYVIDSGRMKEKSYDPYNNVSTLQSSWVSKANAKQRAGRAGRCQPGICYHLYSKLRAASLPEFRVPEVRRMPVEELCLQVKMLDPSCNVHDFLQKLMDPPVDQSVANALTILKEIGALTPQEELTELGQKFGLLPVHPRISKMLYFAILMNCLDSALILACAADTKDPFIMPLVPGERKKAAAAKLELALFYGDHSDHLATVAAFHCWKDAKKRGQSAKFCSKYYVSVNAMMTLDNLHDKLHAELKRHGLIPSDDSNCSLNAHDPGILRAVLAVGLYPMMGRMCPPCKNNKRSLVETITGAKVRVSWNSNKSSSKDDEPLIVFDEITQGDWGVHIRSFNALPTVPLLLFSGEIAVAPTESCDDEEDHEIENEGDVMDIDKAAGSPGEKIMLAPENSVKVVVDRWLPFKITAIEIAQMYILRERLMASILFKVKHPQENLPPHLGASMYAIACILSYDGILKPSVQTAAVEPSASVSDTTGLGEDIPSANHNGSQGNDPNTTPMGSKLGSAIMSGSGNIEESLSSNLANGNEQPDPNTALTEVASAAKEPKKKPSKSKKVKAANNVDLGNMEEDKPSDLANNEQPDPNTALTEIASTAKEPKKKRSKSKKVKAANDVDLGNMEEDKPSDLANNEQPDPNTAVTEVASTAKEPKKKPSKSKKVKAANDVDLGNMEEDKPSDLANNEQPDPNTALTEVASTAKEPKKKRSKSKKVKAANDVDLGNMEEDKPSDLANNEQTVLKPANELDLSMEESLPSTLANENEQPDPNTAMMEAASTVKEPKKKRSRSKKVKAANNLDLGNMEENKASDLANGNEQTELKPADTAPNTALTDLDNREECLPSNLANGNEQSDPKTTSTDLDNMEESLPSNLANGNEQPDPKTAPAEADSAVKEPEKKSSRSKKRKAANMDMGNTEENKPSDLANGNERTELKPADKSGLDNMEESLPSNPATENDRPDPNPAPMEAASAAKQPSASRVDTTGLREDIPSANRDGSQGNDPTTTPLGSKLESTNMEESLPSTLANENEQPEPNTAPTEAASTVKEPKKKRSRSKKVKAANNLDLEDDKPSNPANENEQHDPNSALTEADSTVKEPKKKRSRSKKVKAANNLDLGNIEENKPSDLANGNDQIELKPADTAPNTAPTELGNMEECLPSNVANGNDQPDTKTAPMDLGNMEVCLSSNPANGNEQADPKPAPTEAASAVKEPKKKRSSTKKRKAANLDLGNTEEDKPSDLANGNERTEPKPADTAPNTAPTELGNMEECLPSNVANGNDQPDTKTAPTDLGNMEVCLSSNPANENEQADPKPAPMDLGNMEVCLSSNPANGNEQADPKPASAVKEPKKKRSRSKKRKAANLDLGNTEEDKPSDLANGNERTEPKPVDKSELNNMEESLPSNPANRNEQPNPNTALMEAASVAKQPKKKQSRSKRRKLANDLNSGDNMEEKMPSTNGNEQPKNTDLTVAASMANNEMQAEPNSANKSDMIDDKESMPSEYAKSNEQPVLNTTTTKTASVENNQEVKPESESQERSLARTE